MKQRLEPIWKELSNLEGEGETQTPKKFSTGSEWLAQLGFPSHQGRGRETVTQPSARVP